MNVGGELINPSPGADDEGNPDGGVLDPATARWSELPAPEDLPPQERFGGGILTGEESRCMSTGGLVFDAIARRWIRLPDVPDEGVESRTVVGTDRGAVAFGGFRRTGRPFEARLTNEAVIWNSGSGG